MGISTAPIGAGSRHVYCESFGRRLQVFFEQYRRIMCMLYSHILKVVAQMEEGPFDSSNDNGFHKMNPVTVRIYDSNTGHIGTRLLDM